MATRRKNSADTGIERQTESAADDDTPHMEALKKLRIIIRAAQRHSNWIEKQCGVSGAQLWVMQELYEASGLRVGDVARKLAIHQTTASNLLDALVKRGFVVKQRDAVDQRVVRLALSPQANALMEKAPKPARGLLPEALCQMEPDQLRKLNTGLQGLLDVIELVDEEYGLQPLPFTM